MKTLSNNFQNILRENPSVPIYYIIKMTGSINTYYFSSRETTIADSGTKRVMPLLLGVSEIHELIDLKEHKSSIGGITFKISNCNLGGEKYFSDNFASEYFFNRKIEIYLQAHGLTALSDCLKIYTGIFEDYEITNDIINIKVSISQEKKAKMIFPQNIITSTNFPNANPDNFLKPFPVIYGDHLFKYGADGTSLDVTNSQKNNMAKCLMVNQYAYKNRYLIADHLLSTKETTHARAWMYSSVLEKFVMIDPSNYDIVELDGKTYMDLDKLDSTFYIHDFTLLSGFVNGGMTNPAYGVDGNVSTYAYVNKIAAECEVGDNWYLTVDFANSNRNKELIDTLAGVTIYARNYFSNNPTTFKFNVKVFNEGGFAIYDSDQPVNSAAKMSLYVAEPDNVKSVMFTMEVINNTEPEVGTMRVYYVVEERKYVPTKVDYNQIYYACEGVNLTDTKPGTIISDLIDTYGYDINYNLDSLADMNTILGANYKLSFIINEQDSMKNVLENITKESKSYIYVNANDEFDFFTFANSYTTDKKLYINDILSQSLKISHTDYDMYWNKLSVKYNKSYDDNLQDYFERENSTLQSNYNIILSSEKSLNYIKDKTTAELFADLYCKTDSVAFWGKPRNIVEFETADFRGSNFWESGVLKVIGTLEMLDIIEFNHTEFDLYKKCNGESWENKQFLIFEIIRNKTILKIKAIEL